MQIWILINIYAIKFQNKLRLQKKNTYLSKIEEGQSDPKSIWKIFKAGSANCKTNSSASTINI